MKNENGLLVKNTNKGETIIKFLQNTSNPLLFRTITFLFSFFGILFFQWDFIHIIILFWADAFLNTFLTGAKFLHDQSILYKNFKILKLSPSIVSSLRKVTAFMVVRIGLLALFTFIFVVLFLISSKVDGEKKNLDAFEGFNLTSITFLLSILNLAGSKTADYLQFTQLDAKSLVENRIQLDHNYVDNVIFMILTFIISATSLDFIFFNLNIHSPIPITTGMAALFVALKYFYDVKAPNNK